MSQRLRAIVERMGLQPHHRVLEIGCGHGIAAALICDRLSTGRLVAIDRSAKMVAAAKQRNAKHIAAGKAEFHVADMLTFNPGGRTFDQILAVRVGLFHREPERAHTIVAPWLAPGARILAVFDLPVRSSRP